MPSSAGEAADDPGRGDDLAGVALRVLGHVEEQAEDGARQPGAPYGAGRGQRVMRPDRAPQPPAHW